MESLGAWHFLLIHSMLLVTQGQTRGVVSKLYKFISDPWAPLSVVSIWDRDLPSLEKEKFTGTTYGRHDTFKNPEHQLMHFKFIHRMYLIPRKRHAMKIITSPICDSITLNSVGSFIHMYWDCSSVSALWRQILLLWALSLSSVSYYHRLTPL